MNNISMLDFQIDLTQKGIEKWSGILNNSVIDLGSKNCPYCKAYEDWDEDKCDPNCPMISIGGLSNQCRGGPYIKWHFHHKEKHPGRGGKMCLCEECKVLANEELKLLQRILKELNLRKLES